MYWCESPLYWHACMCGTWGAFPASFVRGGPQIGVRSQPLFSEVGHMLHVYEGGGDLTRRVTRASG